MSNHPSTPHNTYFAFFLAADVLIAFCRSMQTDPFRICVKSAAAALPMFFGLRFRTLNGPIWFLFVLFVVHILFYVLSEKKRLLIAFAAAPPLLTFLLFRFSETLSGILWLNVIPAFGFLIMFAVGFCTRYSGYKESQKKIK